MLGFRGVKLPPFFGLRKFFGKYLFKMAENVDLSAFTAFKAAFSTPQKGWHPTVEGCQHRFDFDWIFTPLPWGSRQPWEPPLREPQPWALQPS